MNSRNYHMLSVVILLTIFLICSGVDLKAQKAKVKLDSLQLEYAHVEWLSSWNSVNSKQSSKAFKSRFNTIIFGIKSPVLSNPVSIFARDTNNFWIMDQGNKTVFHVQNGVGEIPHQIIKAKPTLASLVGICSGPNSGILFTDSKSEKIYRISSGKSGLQLLNDTLKLDQPTGIAYSPEKKEIWVLETKAHRISVLSEDGRLLRRIGKRGSSPGEFNYPTHIWMDKNGLVYVTDAMNFRIQVLNTEGQVVSVFGKAGDSTGFLARPKGIATDSYGNIYVVDALFHAVQVFDLKGNFLYTFGSQGHNQGEFWMPNGIFIDQQDNIYVADTYNSRVQIFKLIYTGAR
jgi:DNA-binding beta-propeller fold protein YncE